MRTEGVGDIVTGALKREVAEEQSVSWLAELVTVTLATVVLSFSVALLRVGEINIHGTAVEFGSLLSSMSLGGIGSVDELNIAKTVDTLV